MTGEKTKGRKRHIVTDCMGNLLSVNIHAANIHDTIGGCKAFDEAVVKYPTIGGVCADEGYRKTFENHVRERGLAVELSKKIKAEWHVLPKRWRIERTFSWLNGSRRLSKDYEITKNAEKNYVYISHSAILLNRLTA